MQRRRSSGKVQESRPSVAFALHEARRLAPDAKFIEAITHREALEQGLEVMDSTALSLCMDNRLPIHVFNMDDERNIERIVSGERVGTIVSDGRQGTRGT